MWSHGCRLKTRQGNKATIKQSKRINISFAIEHIYFQLHTTQNLLQKPIKSFFVSEEKTEDASMESLQNHFKGCLNFTTFICYYTLIWCFLNKTYKNALIPPPPFQNRTPLILQAKISLNTAINLSKCILSQTWT